MAAEIALLLLCNGLYLYEKDSDRGRLYRVEANRIVREMRDRKLTEEEIISYDLSAYQSSASGHFRWRKSAIMIMWWRT